MRLIKSIITWELWHHLKSKKFKIETEYTFKKAKRMSTKTIEVCLGVGMNQIFPEYTRIEIPQEEESTKTPEELKKEYEEREKLLAEIMQRDQELGLYDDLPHGDI
jgi:hypothetical protein